MNSDTPTTAPTAADSTLLEGLLTLAIEGQTDAELFRTIGDEVSTRLLQTYGPAPQRAA